MEYEKYTAMKRAMETVEQHMLKLPGKKKHGVFEEMKEDECNGKWQSMEWKTPTKTRSGQTI